MSRVHVCSIGKCLDYLELGMQEVYQITSVWMAFLLSAIGLNVFQFKLFHNYILYYLSIYL